MASPAVTYTFVNGNVADASQVNQNFTDIINSLTDGTKSLNIDAITCAGKATLNGAVDLGNAVGDTITVNGVFAGTGGDASATQKGLVSYYDSGSFTCYMADNASAVTAGQTCYYTRIGNIVNLTIPGVQINNATTARYLTTTNSATVFTWPAALTPTSVYASFPIICRTSSSTYAWGAAELLTTGVLALYPSPNGTWSGSSEPKGTQICSVSYRL